MAPQYSSVTYKASVGSPCGRSPDARRLKFFSDLHPHAVFRFYIPLTDSSLSRTPVPQSGRDQIFSCEIVTYSSSSHQTLLGRRHDAAPHLARIAVRQRDRMGSISYAFGPA